MLVRLIATEVDTYVVKNVMTKIHAHTDAIAILASVVINLKQKKDVSVYVNQSFRFS